MKNLTHFIAWLLLIVQAIALNQVVAAVAPEHQKSRDWEAMMQYVRRHPEVASLVIAIDVENRVIRLNDGCEIVFMRGNIDREIVGPKAKLQFDRKTCD